MNDESLAYLTIRELARRLRARETTPTALANYFLDRLEKLGGRLNVVVTLTRERALREGSSTRTGVRGALIRLLARYGVLIPIYRLHRFAVASTYEIALRPAGMPR